MFLLDNIKLNYLLVRASFICGSNVVSTASTEFFAFSATMEKILELLPFIQLNKSPLEDDCSLLAILSEPISPEGLVDMSRFSSFLLVITGLYDEKNVSRTGETEQSGVCVCVCDRIKVLTKTLECESFDWSCLSCPTRDSSERIWVLRGGATII